MNIVCNGSGWEKTVNMEFLKQQNTAPLGPRHVPINHGTVLEVFKERLDNGNIKFKNESGMMSPDKLRYVYVCDVQVDGAAHDYAFSLGFINYNNKARSLTVIAGERVFVCSNESYTGQMGSSKRKHTDNIARDMEEKFDLGLDYFNGFIEERGEKIKLLKNTGFTENDLGNVILNYHRNSPIGNTCINRIINEWDKPSFDYGTGGKTAWDFQNAVTVTLKEVNDPVSRIRLQKDTDTYINSILKKTA